MFLVSGLAATAAAIADVGFGNAITSTNGFSLPQKLAVAVVLVPLGAGAVIRHVRIPLLGGKRFRKVSGRVVVTALATVVVATLLLIKAAPTLSDELSIGALFQGAVDVDG